MFEVGADARPPHPQTAAATHTTDARTAHRTAHRVGLRSNVTMMFGTVEHPASWVTHLLAARDVPLAAVEDELARRFGVSGLDEKAARGRAS